MPSTQPDNRPIKTLSAKPKDPDYAKTLLNTFPTSTLISPTHSPITSLYRHHGCHWLSKRLKELSIPENQGWAYSSQGQLAQFAVIDGKTVITGSFNWSPSAAHQNDEVLLVIRSPQVAAHFTREMDRLWRTADLGITERLRRKLERNRQLCGSGVERL